MPGVACANSAWTNNGNTMLSIFDGFRLLTKPGLRRFVILPVLINIIVFTGFLFGLFQLAEYAQAALLAWLPDWLNFVSWLIWPVWLLLALILLVYGFSLLCNLIAAPFNGLLSEQVEKSLGYSTPDDSPSQSFIASIPGAIVRELQKLWFSIKWLVVILILSFIPVVNLLAVLISAWLMAVEYIDYPADNRNIRFRDFLTSLRKQRLPALFFGLSVVLVSMIPVVNFLVMPAAICAGTRLWHEQGYRSAG